MLTHISLIGFATALSARAVDPIIVPIAQGLGDSPEKVALLSTAFALPFALVQPILGPVADMIGKVRLMIICLVVMLVASVACAAATSFTMLLVARVVVGMATGWAIARDEPTLAILHTTAGLGNGVGAIATATSR